MDFDGPVDPEIAARHKAVFDDLMNEIDGLESDDDDEKPQPKSKPVSKPAPSSNTGNRKPQPKADDDMDFPKFGNSDLDDLQKELKMKNNFDDLEKELNALESDEDDADDINEPSPAKKPAVKETRPIQQPPMAGLAGMAKNIQESKPTANKVPQAQNTSQTTSGKKPSEPPSTNTSTSSSKSSSAGAAFPIRHFTGSDAQKLITIDNKFHGKDYLKTLRLCEHEIKDVIDPCLNSQSVSAEVKAHLEAKKKSVSTFKTNITSLFQSGKLNASKYLQLVSEMKTANLKVAQDLQKSNAAKEAERVKERLKVLLAEEKEFMEKAQGGSGKLTSEKKTATYSNDDEQLRRPSLADTLKPTASNAGPSVSASQIDSLSSDDLLKLLKKRKDQYWNLASYMNKELIKNLEGNDAVQKKQELQSIYIPLIQKASKFIEALESGQDEDEVRDFLKSDFVEITPKVILGKSIEQRSQDLQKYIQVIKECIAQETDYVEKLRGTLDAPNQTAGPNGKKVKDGEKALENLNGYVEYLSKLDSDKFMWVPTPKISVTKEQRLIQLVNKDIPANALLVKFNQLYNITPRGYYIKWSVDTDNGTVNYTTPTCHESSLKYNYQQMVQMTNKEKIDQSIENKQIKVEICFKKLLFEHKKCEVFLPLAPIRKTNTIEEKMKVRDDNIELSYTLKVREPLLKHIKVDVSTINAFTTFPPFNKDAPVPQQTSQPKPAAPSQPSQPKKEEQKVAEPPAQKSGGGLFDKKKYPPLVLLKQKNDPLASLTPTEYPAGLTAELILDPANPDSIDCLSVLKKLAEELEKARPQLAAEGRRDDNKTVSDNWTKALRKATILEAKFGSGDIEPQQYVDILKLSIDRDKKLLVLYKSKGDNDRLAFVTERAKLTMQELKELEEALAAAGEEEA